MILSDLFIETYSSMTANKARSGLTALGIVIGIGSVIAMVSIGQGARQSIESSIQSIGSNLLMVRPGFQSGHGNNQVSFGRGSAQTLTQEDADAIMKEIPFIQSVAPQIDKRYQITFRGQNTNTSVIGTVSSYADVRKIEVEEGSFIADQNTMSASKVAVLGPTVRDDLFGEGVQIIGQSIKINKVEFKVIGVTKSKGGSGFGSQDDVIYIPISSLQRFLSGDKFVSSINVEAQDQESVGEIQDRIKELLLLNHNISDPEAADFSVLSQADIVETASSITGTLTILLGAIAGISLIVGGIGIMNMMLTTVTERTREIGLRKAIGAKKSDISAQFLAEAVALTFLGGFFGVIFGWLVSRAVSVFGGIATSVTVSSVALAFGVSAFIGIVFGYYPARRAASLNPIEALRHE